MICCDESWGDSKIYFLSVFNRGKEQKLNLIPFAMDWWELQLLPLDFLFQCWSESRVGDFDVQCHTQWCSSGLHGAAFIGFSGAEMKIEGFLWFLWIFSSWEQSWDGESLAFAGEPLTPHWEPRQGTELPSSSWIPLFCSSPHQFSFEFPLWSLFVWCEDNCLDIPLQKKEKVFLSCSLREARAQVQVNTWHVRLIWNHNWEGKYLHSTLKELQLCCSVLHSFYISLLLTCSLLVGAEYSISPRALIVCFYINRQWFLGGLQFFVGLVLFCSHMKVSSQCPAIHCSWLKEENRGVQSWLSASVFTMCLCICRA